MELKPIMELKSCCAGSKGKNFQSMPEGSGRLSLKEITLIIAVLAAWWIVYESLPHLASYLTFNLFGLQHGSHLADAVEFFIYDMPKVLMLLAIVVFGVGIINTFFTPERNRRILAGKRESIGNVLAPIFAQDVTQQLVSQPCVFVLLKQHLLA